MAPDSSWALAWVWAKVSPSWPGFPAKFEHPTMCHQQETGLEEVAEVEEAEPGT